MLSIRKPRLIKFIFVSSRYTSNFGNHGNTSGYNEAIFGENLANYKWQQVDIIHYTSHIYVKINTDRKIFKSVGKYDRFDLKERFYIGGIDEANGKRAQKLYNRKAPFETFEGCMEDIKYKRLQFDHYAKTQNENITTYGNITIGCPKGEYSPITFTHPESYVIVPAVAYIGSISFSFKFRTYESEGLLLTHTPVDLTSAKITLWLIHGRLKLDVSYPHPFKQITLHAGKSLSDGFWHKLDVFVSGSVVDMKLDKHEQSHRINPPNKFMNNLKITLGGSKSQPIGFVGCMKDIFAQGVKVNSSLQNTSRILFNQCLPYDQCFTNPCKNAGRCLQKQNEYKCDCSHTNYTGALCDEPKFTDKESCEDWRAAGKTKDGNYWVSPNRIKPFLVYCKMTSAQEPITIVRHTNIAKQETAYRPSSKKQGFYYHPIEYSIDLMSIRALIAKSKHCRQHLRYNCINSLLFDSTHEFALETGRGARWVSREGQTMDYWAGATPGSKKCACGLTRTCVRHDLACNCDAWDGIWHTDEGYITDSSTLPVIDVKFSVRGTSKSSNFSLGPLECFGNKDPPTITTFRPTTHLVDDTTSSSKTPDKMKTDDNKMKKTTTPTAIANTTSAKTDGPTYGSPIDNPPRIVIIESQGKYITIRQNANQELILIILSVILAVFIIAIIILMIRQNLFLPCKCIDGPAYRDVHHVDSVELGPPSSLFTNVDTEVVEYEASPYPVRGVNGVLINSRRNDSSIHVNVLESNSLEESDRLHLSGGSSPEFDEKEDWNKNKCESPEYEDIECLEMVLLKSPQETIVEVEKLKEALYEVISASEVNINNNPVTKETKDDVMQEDENYNNTLSSYDMQFSRPPSYQDIDRTTSSSSQETQSDSTHAQSYRTSATSSSSWDENSDYETMDNLVNSHDSPLFNVSIDQNNHLLIDKNDHLSINDRHANTYDSPNNIFVHLHQDTTSHSQEQEDKPLMTKTSSSNQNTLKTIHNNEPITNHVVDDACDHDELLTQSYGDTAGHNDRKWRGSDSDTSK